MVVKQHGCCDKAPRSRRWSLWHIASLGIVAFILGMAVALKHTHKSFDPNQLHCTLLNEPRAIQAFHLTGIDGHVFDQQNLKGHWSMLFFGFTHCGSICPTTMAELAKMYRLLAEQGVKPLPQIVMVTLDPAADHLSTLQHYVQAFHPSFYGARGTKIETQRLTKALGIAYTRIKTNRAADSIEHTGTIILFNPEGKVAAFFTMPHQASLMVQDFKQLIIAFS